MKVNGNQKTVIPNPQDEDELNKGSSNGLSGAAKDSSIKANALASCIEEDMWMGSCNKELISIKGLKARGRQITNIPDFDSEDSLQKYQQRIAREWDDLSKKPLAEFSRVRFEARNKEDFKLKVQPKQSVTIANQEDELDVKKMDLVGAVENTADKTNALSSNIQSESDHHLRNTNTEVKSWKDIPLIFVDPYTGETSSAGTFNDMANSLSKVAEAISERISNKNKPKE